MRTTYKTHFHPLAGARTGICGIAKRVSPYLQDVTCKACLRQLGIKPAQSKMV